MDPIPFGNNLLYETDALSPVDYYEQTASVDSRVFESRLVSIEAHVSPGPLLDVGCNIGTFLNMARSRRWQGEGIEPNGKAAQRARGAGHSVYGGYFSKEWASSRRGFFQAVTLNDVVEHVPNPVAFLSWALDVLVPGGVLAVNTPNFASPLARAVQVKPDEHYFYFRPETLVRTLEAAGGRLIHLSSQGRPRNFNALKSGRTLVGRWAPWVSSLLVRTGGDRWANALIQQFFRDELFLLAQRA